MDWPSCEADLAPPVEAYLQQQGYEVRREVWINGRIADLYAWTDDGDTVAVELKLSAWKTAVAQAMTYQVGAKRAYIAVPLPRANKLLTRRTELEKRGVGLISVAPPDATTQVRTLVRADRTARYLPFTEERVRDRARRTPRGRVIWADRGRS